MVITAYNAGKGMEMFEKTLSQLEERLMEISPDQIEKYSRQRDGSSALTEDGRTVPLSLPLSLVKLQKQRSQLRALKQEEPPKRIETSSVLTGRWRRSGDVHRKMLRSGVKKITTPGMNVKTKKQCKKFLTKSTQIYLMMAEDLNMMTLRKGKNKE